MGYCLETISLCKKYGDFQALNGLSMHIPKGAIYGLVGKNGAGKTTLIRLITGIQNPTSGEYSLYNIKNTDMAINKTRRRMGAVVETPAVYLDMTAEENLIMQYQILGIPNYNGITELLTLVSLADCGKKKVKDFSLGMKQRLGIAVALCGSPDFLILDEPTAVLTPQEVDELMVTLKQLKEQGKTIIVITHKLREVMELADSITVIKQGKVIGNVLKKDTNEQELAQMMVGRDVVLTVSNTRKQTIKTDIMYEAKHLTTVNDYGKEVVSDVSFKVHKGEILGVAGVEGNGQSELVKLITGLMESTKGEVIFDGQNVTNWWPEKLRKAGLGIIPEDRYAQGLCREMSVSDNCIAGYHGAKDICKRGLYNRKKINEKRDSFIKEFDIRLGDVNGPIGNLSGGNAQKVIIARELSVHPKVLLACQPTRGVDIGSIEFIHKQILKFRDEGNTVILVSSELSEIMSLSDRVIVMYKGKISGEVCPKEVSTAAIGLLMAGIFK